MNAKDKLDVLTNLGAELVHVKDIDILMERLLTEARRFVNADAGSIYIKEGDRLLFSYCQNGTLQQKLDPGAKLVYSTFRLPIDEKSIAGYAAKTGQTLNIPDVYHLEASVPYGFDNTYDRASGYRTTSILTLPLSTTRNDIVGVLQMINASSPSGDITAFTVDDEKLMSHFAGLSAAALERAQMTRIMLLRMIRMAELRDPKETGAHVIRVGAISAELYEQYARRQGISAKEIEKERDVLRMAAMMHDVGKVGIPDAILKKPGRFTKDEFDIMKEHAVFGARLFLDRKTDFDEAAFDVILNHHERWDGTGYPGHVNVATGAPLPGYELSNGKARGKRGLEIPLFGRIAAIADVYDALLSKRVYKEAWSEEDTFRILREGAGTQFDPTLIEVFFESTAAMRSIREQHIELA